MEKRLFFFLGIVLVLISVNSCKTTCCHNITPVSFGANTDVLNQTVIAKVFVDDSEIGVIPGSIGYVDTCDSENTLNVEFGESFHRFKIVILDVKEDTIAFKEGEFDVTTADCIKIFFDLNK